MSEQEYLKLIDAKFDEKLGEYKKHSWKVFSALIIAFIIFISGLFFNDHILIIKHGVEIKQIKKEVEKNDNSINNLYDLFWGRKSSNRGK